MKAFDLVWTCSIFSFPNRTELKRKKKRYLLFLSTVVETIKHTCSKLYMSIRIATNTETSYQYLRKQSTSPYETKEQTA